MPAPWEKYAPTSNGSAPWEKYNQPQAPSAASTATDIARTASGGLIEGIPVVGPAIRRGVEAAAAGTMAAIDPNMTFADYMERVKAANAQEKAAHPVIDAASQVTGGLGGSLAIPGGMVSSMGRAMATGGATTAADMTARSYFDTGELPSLPQIAFGTMLGVTLSAAGYKLGEVFQRPKLKPQADRMVNVLHENGVDVLVPQATHDPIGMKRAAMASGAYAANEKQMAQFSRAALRKAGIIADDGILDPDVLMGRKQFIGQQMDMLAARNPMTGPEAKPVFAELQREALDIVNRHRQSITTQPAKILGNTVVAIRKAAKKGTLTGEEYQDIASKLEQAARDNPAIASVAREMRGAVNRAMEKYISKVNPEDGGLWQMANKMYSNALVIENAAARRSEQTAQGLITPQALASAIQSVQGKKAYVYNLRDFSELAKAGVAMLRPLPIASAGNTEEMAKVIARKLTRDAVGGAMGFTMGGIPGALAGAFGTELAAGAASNLRLMPVMSRPVGSAARAASTAIGLTAPLVNNNPFMNAARNQ